MAEYSGFFNSIVGDVREYSAAEFAEYFSRFISDGVYSENEQLGLRVTADGMNANVATGFAYIRGYVYKNDTELSKPIEPADNTLNRIDRLVLRFDEVEREIRAEVKTGSYSSSPAPPSLENTGTVKELSLAQIRVNAKASTVQVTDERLTEYCGQVSLIIDMPLNDLMAEWDAWIAANSADFDSWRSQEEAYFNTWLSGLEDALSGVDAAAINTRIDGIDGQIATLETDKMENNRIHLSALDADVNAMSDGDIWIKYE